MSRRITRRHFLKTSAAVAALSSRVRYLHAADVAAPTAVNVALIGAGGKGLDNTRKIAEAGAKIVAFCDIDPSRMSDALKTSPTAKTYTDFRRMLETQKDIEAVIVTVPDHMHAFAAMRAIEMGKHVYCEKPLAHSILEARTLREAAAKAKVATQMGNSGHSSEALRLCVEWIQFGAIGAVPEVHVWSDRPASMWRQGMTRPPGQDAIPAGFDWDLWLGPAPKRPYKSKYPPEPNAAANPDAPQRRLPQQVYHPFVWRGWCDFGTGALGDMGCHIIDCPFWALKLGQPTSIEAEHSGFNGESYPLWSIVTYQFPQRGELPPVKMIWYDGGKMPPRPKELEAERRLPTNGALFVGETGTILYGQGQAPRIIPEEKMQAFKRPDPFIPRVTGGHHREWLDAIRGGKPSGTNFEYAGPLTEVVLAGNLSLRANKRIEWDGQNMKATNAPQLDPFIRPKFREGWNL